MVQFATRLKQKLREIQQNQKWFAEQCDVSQSYISQVVLGHSALSWPIAQVAERLWGWDAAELVRQNREDRKCLFQ